RRWAQVLELQARHRSLMANFVRHEPCPNCGSSDSLARYDDNSAHCFKKCGYNERADGSVVQEEADTSTKDWTPIEGEYTALLKRGISEETCRFAKYQTGTYRDKPCHIANFYDKQKLTAQKIR